MLKVFLVDTNVVSETRKTRPDANVMAWLAGRDRQTVFLSVVTLAELQKGAESVRGRRPAAARSLHAWINALARTSAILPVNQPVAREWGRLLARASSRRAMDLLITATAIIYGLTVATRNIRDFDDLPVAAVNPFETP